MNEDIITALKNAINSGEPMDTAMQILVNSGYDPREVQESSRYVSQGVISDLHSGQNVPLQSQQSIQAQQPPSTQEFIQPSDQSQINQQTNQNSQLDQSQQQSQQTEQQTTEMQHPIIKNKSHTKEIILVLILIFLMGVLAVTVFFKDAILSSLS